MGEPFFFFGDEIHDMGDGQGKESKDTLPSGWSY